MISYEQITRRIEILARASAILTLFILPISTSAFLVLFFSTTLLVLLSGHWQEKWNCIRNNPIAWCLFGFYGFYLIGVLYSIGSTSEILHQLLKFSWLLLAPLWMPLFTDTKWRQYGINAFLFAMSITLVLSYVKHFQWIHNPHFWLALNHRFSPIIATVFKDHLIQSFLMSLAAMIFLFRFIQAKNWGYALLFVLATLNILLISQSRTGYVTFIILLVYMLFSQLTFKKACMICLSSAVILATFLMFLPSIAHQRLHRAMQDIQQWKKGYEQTSLGYRLAWQKNAIKLIEKRPIVGYGTGSIRAAYATLPPEDTAQTGIVDNTSNEYLNVAVQFGGIGLLLFISFLVLQWRYSFLLADECGLLIQTLLIALCVGNLANSWLMDFTQGHYYALITALAFSGFSKHSIPSRATDHANNDDVAKDIPV